MLMLKYRLVKMIKILQILKEILIRPISCIYLIKILTQHIAISLVL